MPAHPPLRARRSCLLVCVVAGACSTTPAAMPDDPHDGAVHDGAGKADDSDAPSGPVLRVEGERFVDALGRTVILRGVNLAGSSKLPPFLPLHDLSALDPLEKWGMNAIRLVFVWEAYEPAPEEYDQAYLDRMVEIAEAAWERGLFVIVDFHQDGFSRYTAGGCGDGFPLWAVPSEASIDEPDNGPACILWPIETVADVDVHRSFHHFYANTYGVRDRYLEMVARVAERFSAVAGVIGYDLLNEPWADEKEELAPLYEDAARSIRAEHPEGILFIEGVAGTNGGIQTGLPRPTFDNFAYAPHFYDTLAIGLHAWSGVPTVTDAAFHSMTSKAREWGVPLFLGEFGLQATALNAAAYVDLVYDRLDDHLASGAQWNYTPLWDPETKDGWNREDLSIVDDSGRTRSIFRDRPFPRRVAGTPIAFRLERPWFGDRKVVLEWDHLPGQGGTFAYVPVQSIFGGEDPTVRVEGPGLSCTWNEAMTKVACDSDQAGRMRLVVEAR